MRRHKNKKSNLLSICEVSALYGIPMSTLRYWEKEGLCTSQRNSQNNYRVFDLFDTIIDLGDAVFYRNIDIPFDKVRDIKTMTAPELSGTLSDIRDSLETKISDLRQKIEFIEHRIKIIDELRSVEPGKLYESEIPFCKVIRFDYDNREHFKRYLSNPNCFVALNGFTENMLSDVNGISVESDYPGEVLFESKPGTRYIMSYCKNIVHTDHYQPFELIRAQLEKRGISPNRCILQFLINMTDESGNRCDYYKMWVLSN